MIDRAPVNSGNFRQGGARAARGMWLYRPLSEGLNAYRGARSQPGVKKGRDSVREILIRGAISAELLSKIALR